MNILNQGQINKLNRFKEARQKGSEGVYQRSLYNHEIEDLIEELETEE